jgi:hypothetical protein
MIAVRNGIEAVFSDNDWKTGQPQRYGWVEKGKEGKTLPKEIVDFIERKPIAVKPPPEPVNIDEVVADAPTAKPAPKRSKSKQPKQKTDDNSKQKNRNTGKRKRGSLGKT